MTNIKQRLIKIEDRKIEILMEIAGLNREYDERMSALREEYAEIDSEHYLLQLQRLNGGGLTASQYGDGES